MAINGAGSDAGASVEEILESIKRVMDRDSRDSANQMRNRKVEEARQADAGSAEDTTQDENSNEREVLDLSEMELDDVIEIDDIPSDHDSPSDATDEDSDGPLVADDVRCAMQENLAALAMLSKPPAKPQIVRSGETSLEGLTRELLRPMLKEWLDQNLPGMVEKMVQAEIARIAGKRG